MWVGWWKFAGSKSLICAGSLDAEGVGEGAVGRPSDNEEGECSGVGDVRASGLAAMHALVSRAAQPAALRTAHRRAVMRPPSRRPPPPPCDIKATLRDGSTTGRYSERLGTGL